MGFLVLLTLTQQTLQFFVEGLRLLTFCLFSCSNLQSFVVVIVGSCSQTSISWQIFASLTLNDLNIIILI